jgi:hypothetical protein
MQQIPSSEADSTLSYSRNRSVTAGIFSGGTEEMYRNE